MADTPDLSAGESVEELGDFLAEHLDDGEQTDEQKEESQEEQQESPDDELEAENSEAEGEQTEEAKEADELPELAETLEGLAEQIGVDAADLLALGVTIKVNGKDKVVTIADALNGHALESDAAQRSEVLAAQQHQFNEQVQRADTEYRQRFQNLDQILQFAATELMEAESNEDLDQLLTDGDTEGYLQAKRRMETRQAKIGQIGHERNRLMAEEQTRQQAAKSEYRSQQEQLLLRDYPELNDPEKGSAFDREITTAVTSYGFSPVEVEEWMGGAYDHRHIKILKDAIAFKALQNGKASTRKKLKLLPKVRKPGASRGSEEESLDKTQELKKRVRSAGGRDEDLNIRLFEDFA